MVKDTLDQLRSRLEKWTRLDKLIARRYLFVTTVGWKNRFHTGARLTLEKYRSLVSYFSSLPTSCFSLATSFTLSIWISSLPVINRESVGWVSYPRLKASLPLRRIEVSDDCLSRLEPVPLQFLASKIIRYHHPPRRNWKTMHQYHHIESIESKDS